MTDIVERLRDMARSKHHDLTAPEEAAYEIERLRAERDEAQAEANAGRQAEHDADLERRAVESERDRLREALRQAIDCVEHWAAYADSYSIAKHDLAGDLRDLRAALKETGHD